MTTTITTPTTTTYCTSKSDFYICLHFSSTFTSTCTSCYALPPSVTTTTTTTTALLPLLLLLLLLQARLLSVLPSSTPVCPTLTCRGGQRRWSRLLQARAARGAAVPTTPTTPAWLTVPRIRITPAAYYLTAIYHFPLSLACQPQPSQSFP